MMDTTIEEKHQKVVSHPTSVTEKNVRRPDGGLTTMRVVDLGSSSLGRDLAHVFEKNVEKARRENKLRTGSSDVPPKP